jgi:hypothetical protein
VERAESRREEDRQCSRNKVAEEITIREREVEELERSAMALEAALSWLPELGKKQSGAPESSDQKNIGPSNKGGELAQETCFGSNIEDLFMHSYERPRIHRWVWVPSARVLEAAVNGVPASSEEIRRYGERAKKITAMSAKKVDSRSFVQVAAERVMENRGGGWGIFCGGAQR